jgi:hypothetical protein
MLEAHQIDEIIYDCIQKYAKDNFGAFGCSQADITDAVTAQGGDCDDCDFVYWVVNRIAAFTLNMSSNDRGIKIDYLPEKEVPADYM